MKYCVKGDARTGRAIPRKGRGLYKELLKAGWRQRRGESEKEDTGTIGFPWGRLRETTKLRQPIAQTGKNVIQRTFKRGKGDGGERCLNLLLFVVTKEVTEVARKRQKKLVERGYSADCLEMTTVETVVPSRKGRGWGEKGSLREAMSVLFGLFAGRMGEVQGKHSK